MKVFRWAAVLGTLVGWQGPLVAQEPKVLMFSKSQGFEHPVVNRGAAGRLSMAEQIVTNLGKSHGFDVTCTKDGTMITAENLKAYRAVFFFTQGDLDEPDLAKHRDKDPPMRSSDRQAILDYVKSGGGFVGTHCGGADTFHNWIENGRKPFLEMVGGEFIGHGPQQVTYIEVVDRNFPALKGWPAAFALHDEWYAYQGFHANMHVLMMLHTQGMIDGLYARPAYPITWCSQYGEGRVFYTGLGHRESVWEDKLYQSMLAHAVLWTCKSINADATPNLQSLFGDADAALTRINPPKK